jgi:hypothetical protein
VYFGYDAQGKISGVYIHFIDIEMALSEEGDEDDV